MNLDPQGNREKEKVDGGSWSNNTINSLNQITYSGATHTYDLDGNLTNDGTWTYSYDAENRMISAINNTVTWSAYYTYDYMGRRVRIRELNHAFATVKDLRIAYDGWHPVAEFDALQGGTAYPTVRSYMWGLDVTGTVHGGGGVGGLLLTTDGTNHQIPLYDANGNVQGLIDAGNGTLEAVYSYSAFGELLGYANPAGGTYAQDNPIRFASKYCDEYTGLYQYNHRMYSPRLGRFITRDPIGEYGGLNLYAYCRNGPVDDWDYLGLMPDGGLGLVFPPADFVYFAGYVLSKIFCGSPDRPLLNEPTYRETWRAFERYTSSGGSLGRPMILRHSAKAEGVDVDEAKSGDGRWAGGPHGNPDWTLEEYRELAEDMGLTGFDGYPESSQIYLGKTLYDLIVFEVESGRDMSDTYESLINNVPGLVLSDEDKKMLVLSLAVGAMMPSGKGGLQKINDKHLNNREIDAHKLKRQVLGQRARISRFDLYQDKATGKVYIVRKGGGGTPIDTGVNIRKGSEG